MKIVTLCGSIRRLSSNHLILKAVRSFFPEEIIWIDFDIQTLPYFDPQNQFSDNVPQSVVELRKEVLSASFIFIATPEYAHGIPGILKNALEWLVCEETIKKSRNLYWSDERWELCARVFIRNAKDNGYGGNSRNEF